MTRPSARPVTPAPRNPTPGAVCHQAAQCGRQRARRTSTALQPCVRESREGETGAGPSVLQLLPGARGGAERAQERRGEEERTGT